MQVMLPLLVEFISGTLEHVVLFGNTIHQQYFTGKLQQGRDSTRLGMNRTCMDVFTGFRLNTLLIADHVTYKPMTSIKCSHVASFKSSLFISV